VNLCLFTVELGFNRNT